MQAVLAQPGAGHQSLFMLCLLLALFLGPDSDEVTPDTSHSGAFTGRSHQLSLGLPLTLTLFQASHTRIRHPPKTSPPLKCDIGGSDETNAQLRKAQTALKISVDGGILEKPLSPVPLWTPATHLTAVLLR